MGVVTHLSFTNGGYRELSSTTNALSYLGVDHVRDAAPNPAHDAHGQAHYAQAAAQGINFTFFADGSVDPYTQVARIRAIEQGTPGSVTSIEGPNEVNNWPVHYQGQGGTAGAQAYMRDLFNAVQADPLLRDITVTGFTDWPFHASTSDASTVHPYPKNGDQPYGQIMRDMYDQNAVDPGKEFFINEIGYHTRINSSGGWEGVSEAAQAKLVLNTYMDGMLLGAKQTYIYQLLDAYAGDSQEEHFGLFRLDNSPKPAATAIHNLTTILADTAGNASNFGTHTLDFTVTNAPDTVNTVLTEKSNGSFQLITWAEPDIWNQDTNQDINVASKTETISFGQRFNTVEIFDPLVGTSAIQTFHNVNSVNVDVSDHPLIVQLSGGGAASAPAGAATVPAAPSVSVNVDTQPLSLSVNVGPDTMALRISQDAWQGDAQYTVKVDGTQIGDVFTAKARHGGESDTLTLHGNWGGGEHKVAVEFLNDAYAGTADTDRNLYVDNIIYNGAGHPELARTMFTAGSYEYAFN
jgi:hypothetical protein